MEDIFGLRKKTKILCTIGPASRGEETIKKLIAAGMNGARINLAHGTLSEHRGEIKDIRRAAGENAVMILTDLPGPKIRIGDLKQGPLNLSKGSEVLLSSGENKDTIPVNYAIEGSVSPGDHIFINDGIVDLRVREVRKWGVLCMVMAGGEVLSHKGVNIPSKNIEYDREKELKLAETIAKEDIDAIGVSFVQNGKDIERVKDAVDRMVIAKIERRDAVRNAKEIMEVSDGVMVARGDLGVEMGLEKIPLVQKELIKSANLLGKPVITATQMLASMVNNRRPTRAEVTDVANAILDGSDTLMLSEETAIGDHPVKSVAFMRRIAINAERGMKSSITREWGKMEKSIEDVISYDAFEASVFLNAKYIITPTKTGSTPRRISRFKPESPIIAFTRDRMVRNFLSLSYGVNPMLGDENEEYALAFVKRSLKDGERIVLTRKSFPGSAVTDSLKIFEMEQDQNL